MQCRWVIARVVVFGDSSQMKDWDGGPRVHLKRNIASLLLASFPEESISRDTGRRKSRTASR